MKVGTRMSSTVCATEVMVIRAGDSSGVLECGGSPMVEAAGAEKTGEPAPASAGGSAVGKRYVHSASGVEVLCVKSGVGSLSISGATLEILTPKKLPSSD